MPTKIRLDDFDLRLLELLQADARMPVPRLAEAVGLSAPACYRRIRALRESGAIDREVAVVRPRTLGWGVSMMVLVVLEREGRQTIDDLMRKLTDVPQVLELWHVTGEFTFVVHIVARDMEDYDELATRLFSRDDRVRSFQTMVVMREARSRKPLPAAD
ncbi:MAG TPA: Lrp/AsnC family transcriptional regulator [Allosphingosinicella sp.]|nr:Lrp/AsnC family transcriptional regulator [Allosphingosinicella sp.]